MAFTRWVRSVSQRQLMTAAKTKVAKRSGLQSRPPEGKDVFWQKVYAPVYYSLPISLRDKVVASMPGSHRKTWHTPAQVSGPAASLRGPWPDTITSAERVGANASPYPTS
jgi:hypothetical protein